RAMRPGDVPRLEDAEHAEPPLEVALLHAVDVGVVEQSRGAIHPASAAAEVAFEAVALRELPAEVRRPMGRPPGHADLVCPHPTSEAFLVVTGEVGSSRRSVEIVDIEAF